MLLPSLAAAALVQRCCAGERSPCSGQCRRFLFLWLLL